MGRRARSTRRLGGEVERYRTPRLLGALAAMCIATSAAHVLFAAERITEYPIPLGPRGQAPGPMGITAGPDGALWFTEAGGRSIGRITTAGVITEYPIDSSSTAIVVGRDGALWVTGIHRNARAGGAKIGRLIGGALRTEFRVPSAPE